jgi:hypothetical protein
MTLDVPAPEGRHKVACIAQHEGSSRAPNLTAFLPVGQPLLAVLLISSVLISASAFDGTVPILAAKRMQPREGRHKADRDAHPASGLHSQTRFYAVAAAP